MLINEKRVMELDPLMAMISMISGRSSETVMICEGVYEIGHFGSTDFLGDYEHYPEISIGAYGVCDNFQQLLNACPELEQSDRKFVVTLTRITKAKEPKEGGWRWHKWGGYIGTQAPEYEYIADERDEIQEVFVYHIYEKI